MQESVTVDRYGARLTIGLIWGLLILAVLAAATFAGMVAGAWLGFDVLPRFNGGHHLHHHWHGHRQQPEGLLQRRLRLNPTRASDRSASIWNAIANWCRKENSPKPARSWKPFRAWWGNSYSLIPASFAVSFQSRSAAASSWASFEGSTGLHL